MDVKERALIKLQAELVKDIDQAKAVAAHGGILELLWHVYQLHWMRMLPEFPDAEKLNPYVIRAHANGNQEALKYNISLLAKFGNWGFVFKDGSNKPFFNLKLVQHLLELTKLINSKYETKSMVELFDVEVSGERDQIVKIDMSSIKNNPEDTKFFNYCFRIDYDNDLKKNSPKSVEILLANFQNEYSSVADLFELELGITIIEFTDFIECLIGLITDKLKEKTKTFSLLPNGNIDIESHQTFINFSLCMMFDKTKLLQNFDKKYVRVFERLSFDVNDFNEYQLRFHSVTRKPIIINKGIIILSPELLLDSIFTNIHYSLLESVEIKQEYNRRKSDDFLDKILTVAAKYGYRDGGRNVELYEGKNQIGDIDLILINEEGHYLLIEAKNHALPMDIYFKDIAKIKEHLKYLQEKWESKVLRRQNHLINNHKAYDIPENYSCMVVSKFPEIISHYSNILILSIQEVDVWLKNFPTSTTFEDFHKNYYESMPPKFSLEDLKGFEDANLFFGTMRKE